MKNNRLHQRALLYLSFFLLAAILSPQWIHTNPSVFAQGINESWTIPIQISNSGTAEDPQLIIDSRGVFHILWMEANSGYMYTNGDGVQFQEPARIRLPVTGNNFRFLPDSVGQIYALWLDPDGNLYVSQVDAGNFSTQSAWKEPQRLSTTVADFAAAADSQGNVHVSYIRSSDTPGSLAGLYYQRVDGNSGQWSIATLLDESPYFRSLAAGDGYLDLATTGLEGGQEIYIAWEDRDQNRINLTRSANGGQTWGSPKEVDVLSDSASSVQPAFITTGVQGQNVLLLWQSDHTDGGCSQNYRWSFDGGETWQPKGEVFSELAGCPADLQVFSTKNNVFLWANINKESYLMVWDGTRWSIPQLQSSLSNYTGAGTAEPINLQCRQASLVDSTRLYVLGCDQTNQNIWITSRQVENVSGWFTEGPGWGAPVVVASPGLPVNSLLLIADTSSRFHAFWTQAENASNNSQSAIYHALFDGGNWSEPNQILPSQNGSAEDPAAAVDLMGRILIVWSGGQPGEIYFSALDAAQSVGGTSWKEPVLLPLNGLAGSAPSITVNSEGVIFVAFAVPSDAQRGIYLIHSIDQGRTWFNPVQIFNAEQAGWEMVNHPQMVVTQNGDLHVLWSIYAEASGSEPQGLVYARSEDQGETWPTPEVVTEKPVKWDTIIGIGGKGVHRVWQESSGGRTTLWHEYSRDSGLTWERIAPVSIFGETAGQPALTFDRADQLHLLQFVDQPGSGYSLQHWVWNRRSWNASQGQDLVDLNVSKVSSLSAVVAPNGMLGLSFQGEIAEGAQGSGENNLFFTGSLLDLPLDQLSPLPTLVVLPTATPTFTPRPPIPTPTPFVLPPGDIPNRLVKNPDSLVILAAVAGLIVAAAIVFVIFFVSLRRQGRGR